MTLDKLVVNVKLKEARIKKIRLTISSEIEINDTSQKAEDFEFESDVDIPLKKFIEMLEKCQM